MFRLASVVLEKTAYSYDRLYDYVIPDGVYCEAGCRVTVPFGKGNTHRQGIVLSVSEKEDNGEYKPIYSVEDAKPVISAEMIKLCLFLRERTFCTYFDAVRSMLPSGLGIKIKKTYTVSDEYDISKFSDTELELYKIIKAFPEVEEEKLLSVDGIENTEKILKSLVLCGAVNVGSVTSRKVGDATLKSARLALGYDVYDLTSRQGEVVEMLSVGPLPVKEIMYYTGVSQSVITTLERKGVIELYEQEVFRTPYEMHTEGNRTDIELNEYQSAAYNGLCELYSSPSAAVALLYGVTGSGKTKVYLKLVDKAVDEGKNVIVMVPEISLTPQTLKIFSDRYGDKIALMHSAMSLGQRLDEWKRVKNGDAKVVIGTRSAVFAPFSNIGLIIVDEEQEHTYKSEQSPRFDAREVAKFRVNENSALLVLASATPSVETYSAAKSGRYSLFTLPERYGAGELPEVVVVDMRKEILSGARGTVSATLREALKSTLSENKQAIVLLNRRGHNSFVSCPTCGAVETCPNCSISLTYHSANRRMMCHYCGYSVPFTGKCSTCQSDKVRLMGMGTQLVEEELKGLFPTARILRMDADSTVSRCSYSEMLGAFSRGEYDIMLGTQMVAKGLDFPNVNLVGVIGADQAMYSDDYRSYERTFALLTQVVGRSGRNGGKGTAVIQTTSPESAVIMRAASQDYDAFYNDEIMSRKIMVYPPYCDIALAAVSSTDYEISADVCRCFFENIKQLISNEFSDVKVVILGPAPASVPKVGGRYRNRMIIKCKNNRRFRDMLRAAADATERNNRKRDYSLYIDIAPERIP